MLNCETKCNRCKKPMDSFHHYYVYEKEKQIEICKKCYNKGRIRRAFVRVQGKTRVID